MHAYQKNANNQNAYIYFWQQKYKKKRKCECSQIDFLMKNKKCGFLSATFLCLLRRVCKRVIHNSPYV